MRIHHDNALSEEPGCGRTPWHHDAEPVPLASTWQDFPPGLAPGAVAATALNPFVGVRPR